MKTLNVRPLTEDLQKVAIEELNEVPDRVGHDIEALRTWIQQQPHLRARTNDQFLLSFLRGCKFSLEKAKSKIDKYYTLRSKYPDFFTIQNVNDPRIIELIRLGIGLPLPTPLHGNGARIMLIRAGIYPPDKISFESVMCVANTLQEITMLEDDYANINGIVDILDCQHISAGHMVQMTPTVMKKMSTYAEEALPLRQKATHFINTASSFETVFNVLKPLMPEKQQERLYVHGNKLDKFYEHVPQKYLPKEYGGENGSIEELIQSSIKKFMEYREFFMEESKYGTDEKLRIGKSVDYDSIFGVDGSFRKLNVD